MDFRRSFRWESRKGKPLLLLKDYLMDDLSSCSSSGFTSLPRRPGCSSPSLSASVRFLIDVDLRSNVPAPNRGLSRSSSTALFRSAAVKIVNVVMSPLRVTCFLLCRGGQSGKFIRNEAEEDIGPWNPFDGEESIKWGQDVATSILSYGEDSNSSKWDRNGIVSEGNDPGVTGREIVDGTDGQDRIGGRSTSPCSKELLKDKEQFSPVSVLDCPLEDDEDTIDTQSKRGPTNFHTQRGNHTRDGLSWLAPVELEKQITSPALEEERTRLLEEEEEEEERGDIEANLVRMLETVKAADIPSYNSKSDVLLLDFFREKLSEWEEYWYVGIRGRDSSEDEVVRAVEEWMSGEMRDAYVGWEIEERRMAYIKDMERGGDLARYEVCLEVDNVVWTLLVYEAVIDIIG